MRILLTMALVSVLPGCFLRDHVRGPRTQKVTVERLEFPDGTVKTTEVTTEADAGEFRGTSAKDMSAGSAEVDGGATAYGLNLEWFKQRTGVNSLDIAGAVVIVAGCAIGYLIAWGLGLAIVGAGLTILVTGRMLEMYPWAFLIAIAAAVGAGGYVLYQLWRGKQAQAVERIVVSEIEMLGKNGVSDMVVTDLKDSIAKHARTEARAVKAEVGRVKRKLSLA